MRLRLQSIAVTVTVLVLSLILAENVARLESERDFQREQSLVTARISSIRARLEAEVNSSLYLSRGLIAYAAANPRLTHADFDRLAAEIVREGPHIRNIGLAPDNVLSFIYPLKGNEKALGLRYMEIPEQRAAVQRAIDSGETVVAGPVNLVQGGRAFINRTPIFTPQKDGTRRYWGLASVVVNMEPLLASAGLATESEGVRYALRGRDGMGAKGEVFFGDSAIFYAQSVKLPIRLPGGEWQLAALPVNGWDAQEWWDAHRVVGYLLAVMFSGLVLVLLLKREREKHLALHDTLTGLPNRLYFDLRLEHAVERAERHRGSFALLYLDLDDFKPVNDSYGHKAGDRLLLEVGRRLRENLRRVDTVARIGGDEFMLILDETADAAEVQKVAAKIIEAIHRPILVADGAVSVGVSIGASFYPQHGTTPDALIRSADRAMYEAKKLGKNRCVCEPPAVFPTAVNG